MHIKHEKIEGGYLFYYKTEGVGTGTGQPTAGKPTLIGICVILLLL